jgi:uncharacterized protein
MQAFYRQYWKSPRGTWLTTLPILYNNALIGRIDPKAHRKEDIFEVKALHLEPGVVVDDALVAEVRSALQACAA